MPSQIDPTKPVDGIPASKADLRTNLQSAKDEIEALQSGKADVGHQHGLADITDPGALASKNTVASDDIDDSAVTSAKIADANVSTDKLAGGAVTNSKIADAAVTPAKIDVGGADRALGSDSEGDTIALSGSGGIEIVGSTIRLEPASIVPITVASHTLAASERFQLGKTILVDAGATAVTITLPDAAAVSAPGYAWRILVAATQTGAVVIERETNGTINGGTSVTLAGPRASVELIVDENTGSAPEARAEGGTTETATLGGDIEGNGKRIGAYRNRKYGGLIGAQTLGAANFKSGSKLIHTGSAATYTLPSRLTSSDTAATEELKVRNGGSGAITWSASGVTMIGDSGALAAGATAVLEWEHDGTTERVEIRATA